jgi:hypothetical protein
MFVGYGEWEEEKLPIHASISFLPRVIRQIVPPFPISHRLVVDLLQVEMVVGVNAVEIEHYQE